MNNWVDDRVSQLKGWIFPKKCFSCGQYLYSRSCSTCLKDIVGTARLRQSNHHNITHFYWFEYTHRLRELLKEIKFNRDRHLLQDFLDLMRPHFGTLMEQLKPGSLAAVPLHHRKLKERGFNQAEIIAKSVDAHLHHLIPHAFSRIQDTPALFDLKEIERQQVLKNAFQLQVPDMLAPVILVDDILTTGTTLHTLKDLILQRNSHAQIYFVTLSFTPTPG